MDTEFHRILEVGVCPELNAYSPPAQSKTNAALLAENPNYCVAGVDRVNIWNSTYTGDGKFFLGSFLDEEVQLKIEEYLGGKPDIILGKNVFIKDLYSWRQEHRKYNGNIIYPQLSLDEEIKLVVAANNFLAEGGLLVIENIPIGAPDIVSRLPLVALYQIDELYRYNIQFRQKADL